MEVLRDYYFAHDEMFLIPIEHLSSSGMSGEFQQLVRDRLRITLPWIALFNQAFADAWQRLADLAERAPQYWFPPRLQHACIVTDPTRVRPFFQPINKSAWLLYATDFDPSTSNREFATYQFIHAERMGLLQEVTQAAVRNLSYWLLRSDAEVEQFRDGCRRACRPDAAAFRALAEAMPWIRKLHHESLRKPLLVSMEPCVMVPHTGLVMPRSWQAKLDALVRSWGVAAQGARDAFRATYARSGRNRAGELCAWLQSARPLLLVTGSDGRILWDPEQPEHTAPVRGALGGIGAAAADSIRADLEVIDGHSRRFLASLRRPEDLALPHGDMGQFGLSYMHVTRRLIAYNLREPGMERVREPAPPYERFMLGARTVHEWAHLATDAGWVPVAAERQREREHLIHVLAVVFEEIYRATPDAVRAHTAEDTARLAQGANSVGEALARFSLGRLADYQANLLARAYLSIEELETYIRNNVYTLGLEYPSTALFRRLARYAYEFQYLRLSRIRSPETYFADSTWFRDEYLARGIVSEALWKRLVTTMGAVCDCYAVDWTRFSDTFAAQNNSGGTG